jgi:hypothetical protein
MYMGVHWAITCRKSNINFTVIPYSIGRFINRGPELEQSSGIIQKLRIKTLTKPETKKGIRTSEIHFIFDTGTAYRYQFVTKERPANLSAIYIEEK